MEGNLLLQRKSESTRSLVIEVEVALPLRLWQLLRQLLGKKCGRHCTESCQQLNEHFRNAKIALPSRACLNGEVQLTF